MTVSVGLVVAVSLGCGGNGDGGGASSGSSSGNAGSGASASGGGGQDASPGASGGGGATGGTPLGSGDSATGLHGDDGSVDTMVGPEAGLADVTAPPPVARVRTVLPFDTGWLFFKGDAVGAEQPPFADASWTSLSVPHDRAIEGPFVASNPSAAGGGFAPAGVGWYRKHFALPATTPANARVFIEFDGVMANSDVYINGFHLGNRPYGYVRFRYGFLLNGVSLKIKGVAMHHDASALGAAVPLRAWKRRAARLKALGANAIRTSHNPVAPEVLDLYDRMGLMVMSEFFDAWNGSKQPADYGK